MPKTPVRAASDRQRRRATRRDGPPPTWESVEPNIIVGLIVAVCAQGGAVRFGMSRDGSALALGFLGDGEPYTEYLRPTDDIEANLLDMTAAWNGEAPAELLSARRSRSESGDIAVSGYNCHW